MRPVTPETDVVAVEGDALAVPVGVVAPALGATPVVDVAAAAALVALVTSVPTSPRGAKLATAGMSPPMMGTSEVVRPLAIGTTVPAEGRAVPVVPVVGVVAVGNEIALVPRFTPPSNDTTRPTRFAPAPRVTP